MRKVVVPGTFDPITYGHLDVIERSASLFDEVIVAVAPSTRKGAGPLFSLEERVALAQAATEHLPNVTAMAFEGLLVDFAVEQGAAALVKGLRVATDFENEFQMAALNFKLDPELETLFIMSSPSFMHVSSSMVKEVASLGGDVSSMVPQVVIDALAERITRN